MKCSICGRDNLTERELDVHKKFFHGAQTKAYQQPQVIAAGACPDCGSTLWFQEGCAVCRSCGYNKCG